MLADFMATPEYPKLLEKQIQAARSWLAAMILLFILIRRTSLFSRDFP